MVLATQSINQFTTAKIFKSWWASRGTRLTLESAGSDPCPLQINRLSVCLPACLPGCLPACLPSWLHACLPTCLPACLPACLPTYLPTYLPACLPTYLPTYLPACLPACTTPLPTVLIPEEGVRVEIHMIFFLPTYLPNYLPACLCPRLPVGLSACLRVCLPAYLS